MKKAILQFIKNNTLIFVFFIISIGSNGVQGVQTRLKRKDRFESK